MIVLALLFAADPTPAELRANPMLVRGDAGWRPVATPADWAARRADVLRGFQECAGPLPPAGRKVPPELRVEEAAETPAFVRKKVTFAVEAGDRLWAYLLVPKNLKGKAPAALCLHQTTRVGKAEPAGVAGLANLHYAEELASRGYVCLAPDYPNFGDYASDPYARGYQSATMKGVWNHMRCVDLLCSLPEVDAGKVGAIGHSLGGHNTVFVSVFDERIKASVSCCGFCSFPRYYGGDLTGWSHKGYMPRVATAYGKRPEKMPFDFPELVAALAPRAFLAVAPVGDGNFDVRGVKDCLAAARPVYQMLGAADRLQGLHPDCGHDFPTAARAAAYEFLDRHLGVGR